MGEPEYCHKHKVFTVSQRQKEKTCLHTGQFSSNTLPFVFGRGVLPRPFQEKAPSLSMGTPCLWVQRQGGGGCEETKKKRVGEPLYFYINET